MTRGGGDRWDPWAVLGLPPTASAGEVDRAYRRLAKAHHPDLTSVDPAARDRADARMRELNAAVDAIRRQPRLLAAPSQVPPFDVGVPAPGAPVACPSCGAPFARAQHLRRHLAAAHGARSGRRRPRLERLLDAVSAAAWRTPLWFVAVLGVLASAAAAIALLDHAPGRDVIARTLPPADLAPRALWLALLAVGQLPVVVVWLLSRRHEQRLRSWGGARR